MTIPETFANDLDGIVRGETLAPTADAEHIALLEIAQRLSDGLLPLRQAPSGARERLEAHLLSQLPVATHRQRMPVPAFPPLRRWQAAIGLAVATALIVAMVGTAFSWAGSSGAVSAQVILDRAEAASTGAAPSGVTSYHAKETRQTPAKGNVTLVQETWYGGNDRQRVDTQVKDAGGTIISANTVISAGDQTWISSTDKGKTQVIHTTGTQWSKPAADPSGQGGIADSVAQYTQKGCMNAQQQGETTLLNRAVYVIALTPKAASCPDQAPAKGSDSNVTTEAKARTNGDVATKPEQQGAQVSTVGQITLWVDKQTFLPLKTEIRSTTGAIMDRDDVTSIEYNTAIPAATFTYTPPAGATVSNFTGGDGRDVKAALGGTTQSNGTPTPGKKP
ncbi:MAG: LolA family protein [Thermomicrobiales bacterium]